MSNAANNHAHDDDSDLDDLLDDVLDDFDGLSTKDIPSKVPAKPDQKPKAEDPAEDSLDSIFNDDEFSRQLAAGMEDLMGKIGNGGQDPEMMQAFEQVWKSLDSDLPPTAAPSTAPPTTNKDRGVGSSATGSQTPSAQSFQDTIAQTMNKLKDSSKQVDSSIAQEGDDAFMAELMKQMESLSDTGEFENVLEGMMQQLMSKEMLYEPIRDLAKKYPSWLEENKTKLEKADYQKYSSQYSVCQEIVAKYEAPGFDEKNESQSKEIMDLMQKMQDYGQPPAALLEEMAPGANFGNPGEVPDMKDLENCTIM
ncbi:Pex19 protein [Phycomyces nitens]|nr:Pex19 protein [Phycomyces nitens]